MVHLKITVSPFKNTHAEEGTEISGKESVILKILEFS
jgi:hypothetical protein